MPPPSWIRPSLVIAAPAVVQLRLASNWSSPLAPIVHSVVSIVLVTPVPVLVVSIVDPAPLKMMSASSVVIVSSPSTSSVEPASASYVPPVSVCAGRLVKVVDSIVTVSPSETSRVPQLVNVVVSMISAPPLEAAVIVPLLVRDPLP